MKIVIVGVGKVGRALVQQLSVEDNSVTAVDNHREPLNAVAARYDANCIFGSGASLDTLKEAEAGSADLVIATASSDEVNILICLIARKLGARNTIARIRNPEYEKSLRLMREDLGLSMLLNPEKETAREIARVLRFPAALKVDTFSRGALELVAHRIPEKGKLDGMRLTDLYRTFKIKVLICAVERGHEVVIPNGDFVLRAGDRIHITASPRELETFFRALGVFRARASSVLLAGGGRISYYLAEQLTAMGMTVTIIERDPERAKELSTLLPKTGIVCGDATDSELLAEEGLERMDGFVALTGLDEANVLLSMYALRSSGCKVIAKINRQSFIDLATFGQMVDSVVSPCDVTADRIIRYVRCMQNSGDTSVHALHRMVGDQVEALEFGVPADFAGCRVPLMNLKLKKDLLIVGITRADGTVLIPSGKDVLFPRDNVVVVTVRQTLRDFNEIFADPAHPVKGGEQA